MRLGLVILAIGAAAPCVAQEDAGRIRLNQAGFDPREPKSVVVADTGAARFLVVDVATGDTIFRGHLTPPRRWAASGETVRRGDFSAVARPGRYAVVVPGVGRSYPFSVDSGVNVAVARSAIKAFYFQRASTDLPFRYAWRWSRAGGRAIGKRFHDPNQDFPDSAVTVVGIVPDFHYREYREATPMILKPFRQVMAQGYFVVRTRASSSVTVAALERAVRDAGAEFVSTKPIDALIAPQLAAPRFDALLLSLFAAAAVILAAIGLYGTMASAVRQQTRELGVRVALGATPRDLHWMVLSRALVLAGCGVVAGLIAAAMASRLLTSLLFEVSASDPLTLIGVSVLLLGVTLLAAYIPARGATRIDPALALRAE